jgi:uncharacterized membrane protein YjdF
LGDRNVLTVLCVTVLVVSYWRVPLSPLSYTCLALFLCTPPIRTAAAERG